MFDAVVVVGDVIIVASVLTVPFVVQLDEAFPPELLVFGDASNLGLKLTLPVEWDAHNLELDRL